MPLIINELVTQIEAPQGSMEQPATAMGIEDAACQVLDSLMITKEREERLQID